MIVASFRASEPDGIRLTKVMILVMIILVKHLSGFTAILSHIWASNNNLVSKHSHSRNHSIDDIPALGREFD